VGIEPQAIAQSMSDIAAVERGELRSRADDAMRAGVRVRDPQNISIRGELRCGTGVEIDLNVIIEGTVNLGDGVKVGANCILINATIGANSRVNPYTMVEDAVIGANALVGPYARVRPGSTIGQSVQIGNFVEIKNSEIGDHSRINHLAFIGDATLGRAVTIGAGTITCNHDGVAVRRTVIGDEAYVGSGCLLVAPVVIGKNATIGAGSTITEDAPPGKLTLARSRQVTVSDWARPEPKPQEHEGD
jgi:bifunctional UDP-N-acetylglucosamine pyrophosphorylase / glucosamine-1-phosphate N-acetyltransferase